MTLFYKERAGTKRRLKEMTVDCFQVELQWPDIRIERLKERNKAKQTGSGQCCTSVYTLMERCEPPKWQQVIALSAILLITTVQWKHGHGGHGGQNVGQLATGTKQMTLMSALSEVAIVRRNRDVCQL